jgi:predicted glycogen debranching enzyme
MISFGRGVCGKFSESNEREWIEANGRGAYAMGTVAGGNSRRYHSLLNIPLRPPVDRYQTVNRLEESVIVGGQRAPLSCQSYPGIVHPQGFAHLERFRLDPFPVWTYVVANVRLEKTFFLRYGEDTAVILYSLLSGPEVVLEVRPLLTCRSHHHLAREDERFSGRVEMSAHCLRVTPEGVPAFYLCSAEGTFSQDGFWYRNQEYVFEQQRGMEHREDAFCPGVFQYKLQPGQTVALVVSTEPRNSAEAQDWSRQERLLRRQTLERAHVRGPLADLLVLAADQFIVGRGDGSSVIAGYPWFEDWSRDTMVSLPGLCLATGRAKEAGEILETYAGRLQKGLLPNRFPDTGPIEYNAVDAPLWFIWAVQKHYQAVKDGALVKRLLPALRAIVDAYQHGTDFGIHMEPDGLIAADAPGQALTWMDALVDGVPVTPRGGKPVEIQALWYNALQFLSELDLKFGEPSRGYDKLAAIARNSFNEKFWNETSAYLYDRVDGRERDASLRPNALFAISLPYEILAAERFKPVVDTAWRELYTTYGLRSLSPQDPRFKTRYEGPPEVRDGVYHEGPVWPWLLGGFLTAFVKAYGSTEETKAQVQAFLSPFLDHLSEAGLGTVSELFDGEAPHTPRGCPAQAWSVGEVLRILWEESLVV